MSPCLPIPGGRAMSRRSPRVASPALRLQRLESRDLPSAVSDLAYMLAKARVIEPRQNFYVYQDQDSAFNHGFPSGKFGSVGKLDIDTGAIDDPASPTGVTTDPNRLDRTRGNVLRL